MFYESKFGEQYLIATYHTSDVKLVAVIVSLACGSVGSRISYSTMPPWQLDHSLRFCMEMWTATLCIIVTAKSKKKVFCSY